MQTAVHWALVGASTIADQFMIAAIRAQGGVIDAVVSGDAQRASDFAQKNAIARHAIDLAAVLADPVITAVYISSTNEKHLPQALAAARAGKHVLCEKPLALGAGDARQMIAVCAEQGVVLGTNHHLRCAATHRALREQLRAGAIGKPLFARVFHAVSLPPQLRGWRVEQPEAGGGVILDISVHDVDTLRYILDDEPVEVSAMTAAGSMGSAGLADGVMSIIRFNSGVLAQLHDAFTVPFAPTGLELHGTQGSLFARDVMTQRPVGEIVLRNADGERVIEVEHASLYDYAVQRFHAAIAGEGTPAATGQDGYRSLLAALALAQSAQSGAHVTLDRHVGT